MQQPSAVMHADWSIHPKKRWMAKATRLGGRWLVEGPWLVPTPADWVAALLGQSAAADASVVVGFDFPIGVPAAYAEVAGIPSFPWLLARLVDPEWAPVLDVCNSADEISHRRPFYPYATGGKVRLHLLDGLGLLDPRDLLRLCERPQTYRPAASPLFWTLGAKQVGKAAITGWREVLMPLLQQAPARVGLWPFDAPFAQLCRDKSLIIIETYPGDVYHRLGFPKPGSWSKQKQVDRRRRGIETHSWLADKPFDLDDGVRAQLDDGFGSKSDGEDRFDAVIGLLGMLGTIAAGEADLLPSDDQMRLGREGWIFGQDPATEKPLA